MNKTTAVLTYLCTAGLLLSGLFYAIPYYGELYFYRDPLWLAKPGTLMKIHGAAAMLMLTLLGSIWQHHASVRLKRPRMRVTGLSLLACLLFLVVSAYLLYYTGSETLREWSSVGHSVLGVLISLALIGHVFLAKTTAESRDLKKNRTFSPVYKL